MRITTIMAEYLEIGTFFIKEYEYKVLCKKNYQNWDENFILQKVAQSGSNLDIFWIRYTVKIC